MENPLQVVTGAFGLSGQAIAGRLLERGCAVRTLTNSPQRESPLAGRIEVAPLRFDDPDGLAASLTSAAVLYNTYWVRFNQAGFGLAAAVENTLRLFTAAKKAGVGRIVHVSISNPSEDSPLEYFRGKAVLERALRESGLSYAILRPTVLFGDASILINNIAWMQRHLPVLAIFGDGRYPIQPVHVDDLAELAVAEGQSEGNHVLDVAGPERFAYRDMVEEIGRRIGRRRPMLSVPPWFGYLGALAMGQFLGDVIITRDEIRGLMAGLLAVDTPPLGRIRLSDWVQERSDTLGRRYQSESARRRDRRSAYGKL